MGTRIYLKTKKNKRRVSEIKITKMEKEQKPTLEKLIADGYKKKGFHAKHIIFGKGDKRLLYDPRSDKIRVRYSARVNDNYR